MGGHAGGGSRGGGPSGGGLTRDTNYKGKIVMVESLVHMQDPQMYKATKEAIARYHSVLGVQEKDIKLAQMSKGVYGVQTSIAGKNSGIYLNSKYFKEKGAYKNMNAKIKEEYKSGWQTKTNKAIAHVVTHELGHATWNNSMTGKNQVAAGKAISKMYNTWRKDTKKSGYGTYSHSNVNEFWAETVTKAVHGTPDKYTKGAKSIIKKYKL